MPATFTESKRRMIDSLLKTKGGELFGHFGPAHTTIEALAAAAGISKGSFYAFYRTKWHLLAAVMVSVRKNIAREITAPVLDAALPPEHAVVRLLKACLSIPVRYPAVKAFYSLPSEEELAAAALESGLVAAELLPIPDFSYAAAHWRMHGWIFETDVRLLGHAAESLVYLGVHGGRRLEQFSAGIDQLLEYVGVGCSGFIQRESDRW